MSDAVPLSDWSSRVRAERRWRSSGGSRIWVPGILVETMASDGPARTATWVIADRHTAGLIGAVGFVTSLLG
jgi:hypothetical protein